MQTRGCIWNNKVKITVQHKYKKLFLKFVKYMVNNLSPVSGQRIAKSDLTGWKILDEKSWMKEFQ